MNTAVLRNELSVRVNKLSHEQILQVLDLVNSFGKCQNIASGQSIRRTLGDIPGKFWMSEDFDDTPECFEEYM